MRRVLVVVILKHCLDAEENLFDRHGRLPTFFIAATAREEREGERKCRKKRSEKEKKEEQPGLTYAIIPKEILPEGNTLG